VRDSAVVEAQLAAAEDLPGLLTVSRDAFGLIRAVCRTSEARSDELSATFTIAAASALHGRKLLTAAPSMPPVGQVTTLRAPAAAASLEYDLDEITGALTGLVSALDSRLRRAGTQAAQDRDRLACQQAAAEAERIGNLLTPRRRTAQAAPTVPVALRYRTLKSALFVIGITAAAFLLTAFITVHNGGAAAPASSQLCSAHPVYCQPGPRPDC
jgi:hypothetical protein